MEMERIIQKKNKNKGGKNAGKTSRNRNGNGKNNPKKNKNKGGKNAGKTSRNSGKGKNARSNVMADSTYNKLWCFDLSLEQVLEKCVENKIKN